VETLKRDLRSELKIKGGKAPLQTPNCGLTQCQFGCHKKGYHLGVRGSQTWAELCSCVTGCAACFGSCRKSQGDKVELCKSPSPPRIATLINESQIPALFLESSLGNFENFTGNGQKVISWLEKWFADFNPQSGHGVLIGGDVGVGKTYLLASICKVLAKRSISCRFVDFFQLLNQLKAGYSQGEGDDALLQPLIDVDVLVIDELGKGRNSDWELTIIDQLIMGRYNQNKPIIASTNFQLKDKGKLTTGYNIDLESELSGKSRFAPDVFDSLETRVGQRVYSRLLEMVHFIELSGKDWRRLHRGMENRSDQGNRL